MATQLLVNVLRVPAVGTLLPGESITLAHGLKVADEGVIPTLIEPNGATNIVVTSADATNVVFTNNDANAGFAEFRVYFDHSVVAEAPVTTLYWNGITGSTSPSGAAGGDLSGTYPDPTVVGLQGDPLPIGVANGFVKRNAANTAWEEVGYGAAADTVTEGNDPRLSDSRPPNGLASGDLSGSYPGPTVAKIQNIPVTAGTPLTGSDLEYSAGSWAPTFRYNSTVTNLYVNNATGSDSNDGLTALTAKKTIQAAVDAAGMFIATTGGSSSTPNVTINIAAQSTTENVTLNGFVSGPGANSAPFSLAFQGAPQTVIAGPLMITALSNTDPDCPPGYANAGGACTITVGGAGWASNAFAGKFVRLTSGAATSYAPIISNTADTLTIVRNVSGQTGFATTAPNNSVEIVEPSTRINGSIIVGGTYSGFLVNDLAIIPTTNLRPIYIDNAYRPTKSLGTLIQRCILSAANYSGSVNVSSFYFNQCILLGGVNANLYGGVDTATVNFQRCHVKAFDYLLMANTLFNAAYATVFEGFTGTRATVFGRQQNMLFVTFKNMSKGVLVAGGSPTSPSYRYNEVLFYSSGSSITHMAVSAATLGDFQAIMVVGGAVALEVSDTAKCLSISSFTVKDCTTALQVSNGSAISMTGLTTLTGVTNGIIADGGSTVVTKLFCNFSATAKPVFLRDRSLFVNLGTTAGTGNILNPLFKINDGSRFVYASTPTVSGGSSDFSFDGTTKAYADLPYFNTLLSGAAIRSA